MATGGDLLVGLVALALVPLIATRLFKGLSEGRLPVYRTYLTREAGTARFTVLLALHAVSLVLVAGIAADLLLNLGIREKL
jgi:ABC-type sulfate transport system permease subunit